MKFRLCMLILRCAGVPILTQNQKSWIGELLVDTTGFRAHACRRKNNTLVGSFEGTGYTKTGMYRSCLHCVMGAGGLPYCKACQDAIRDVIEYYSN